jgi:hypothetical protein
MIITSLPENTIFVMLQLQTRLGGKYHLKGIAGQGLIPPLDVSSCNCSKFQQPCTGLF